MTVWINAENFSSLGDDTFWLWFERSFPSVLRGLPVNPNPDDIILQYAPLGPSPFPERTVAILWEGYPEMKKKLGDLSPDWNHKIKLMEDCARTSRWRTSQSEYMIDNFWGKFGEVTSLPIGIDGLVFRPINPDLAQSSLGLDRAKSYVFWSGTRHPMKGYDLAVKWFNERPEHTPLIVWKHPEDMRTGEATELKNSVEMARISQDRLSLYMSACNAWLSTGRLAPLGMVELEAIACGLPGKSVDGSSEREIIYDREHLKYLGWLRRETFKLWSAFLDRISHE